MNHLDEIKKYVPKYPELGNFVKIVEKYDKSIIDIVQIKYENILQFMYHFALLQNIRIGNHYLGSLIKDCMLKKFHSELKKIIYPFKQTDKISVKANINETDANLTISYADDYVHDEKVILVQRSPTANCQLASFYNLQYVLQITPDCKLILKIISFLATNIAKKLILVDVNKGYVGKVRSLGVPLSLDVAYSSTNGSNMHMFLLKIPSFYREIDHEITLVDFLNYYDDYIESQNK